jgi:L-galactose dehydrogenase
MRAPSDRIRLEPSGLELSRMGFGAAALGGEYGELSEAEGQRAVHAALDAGLCWFDTAPYYGRTLSEERLGLALKGYRGAVCLATKCARIGPREFDFTAQGVRAQLEGSLRRLRTTEVDLYQVHDVEFGRVDQILNETLPELEALRQEGKVRAIGLTGLHPHLLHELATRTSVRLDAVLTYCHHDLLDWSLRDGWAEAFSKLGLPLLSASPTHMGILTSRGPQAWHPAPAEVLSAGRRMAAACRAHDLDLATVALHTAFSEPGPAAILIGARTPAEVRASLEATDLCLPPGLLNELVAAADPVRGMTWHEGLPENAPPQT